MLHRNIGRRSTPCIVSYGVVLFIKLCSISCDRVHREAVGLHLEAYLAALHLLWMRSSYVADIKRFDVSIWTPLAMKITSIALQCSSKVMFIISAALICIEINYFYTILHSCYNLYIISTHFFLHSFLNSNSVLALNSKRLIVCFVSSRHLHAVDTKRLDRPTFF